MSLIRTSSEPPSTMTRRELGVLALVQGGLAGTLFAAVDVWRNAPELAAKDLVMLLRFTAPIGVLITVGVVGLLVGLRRLTGARQELARGCQGVVCLVSGSALTLALVLVGSQEFRDWSGAVGLLFGLPVVGAALLWWTRRVRVWQSPWELCAWTVTLQVALVAAWLSLAGGSFLLAGLAVLLGAILGVGLARSLPAPRTRATAGLLAGAVLLCWPHGSLPDLTGVRRRLASERWHDVVMVVLDTTRQDVLGCYGGTPTPVLDALAEQSVVYEDVYSAAPWTVPSHASLFTGLHPATHGASFEHRLWLDDSFQTLAEVLRERGYQTLALASNHFLGTTNLLQGFDEAVPLQGPYEKLKAHRLATLLGLPERWVDKGSDEAVESLRRYLAEDYNPDLPLFLFVNLLEPHDPYLPPRQDRLRHEGAASLAAARLAQTTELPLLHARRHTDAALSARLRPLYEASVEYQDRRLGELFSLLDPVIDLQRTLTVVTSDHGENLGEHGRWAHLFAINDNLLRLPLVIHYPDLQGAGSRQAGLCQTIDLFATICDVLELPPPDGPGTTLVPGRFTARREVFAQVAPFYFNLSRLELKLGFKSGGGGLRASRRSIRDDHHKYVWSSDGRHELYDVLEDPGESTNLLPARPELAAPLDVRLQAWWESVPRYQLAEGEGEEGLDDETLRRLRALGYVH